MTNQELWEAVLAQVQLRISQANFATWFKNTSVSEINDGVAVISTPSAFAKEWLGQKYNDLIFEILTNKEPSVKEVRYVVGKGGYKPVQEKKRKGKTSSSENQLNFTELKINPSTNLNPKYTFDNFIVGPFNELAHAAAMAVSDTPGMVYNPLFLYGEVGLGKTHLLQAVGNNILQGRPDKKARYVSAEKFTGDMISAIRNHEIEGLKAKYKGIDVLIIDDIQFLAGKEKTQEEFFHIFNALYEKNKQLVISSDRPPKSIPELAERLRSRFEGGMIADISFPDFETRMAILKHKAQEKRMGVEEDVLTFIASNIQRNVRELEGALTRLAAYEKTHNKKPDLAHTKEMLRNVISSPRKITTPKRIIKTVADFYDLKERNILEETRKREVVKPRQVAMFLIRTLLDGSYPSIARAFGGRDHTTVMYACEKIKKGVESDQTLEEEVELIKQRISWG